MSNKSVKDFLLIFIGTTILAASIACFADPAGLVSGGVSGIAIILKYLSFKHWGFSVPLGVTNLVLNVPLFIVAWKQRGFKFIAKSLFGVVWLSVALFLLELLPVRAEIAGDILIASVFSGALSGLGVGLVFRGNATTGGSDMLAAILKFKRPHTPISFIYMLIEGVIVVGGAFVFGIHRALYALLALVVGTLVMKYTLTGVNFAKSVYIISDHNQQIADRIMKEMDRGVTGFQAKGMFTKNDKVVLYAVVSRKEIVKIINIVKDCDKSAFITISDVSEVLGEGFNENLNDMR